MYRTLIPAALVLTLSVPAFAQTTNPIRYTWIAQSCQTWNCAAAALVLAAGDNGVIVLPTGRESEPWIILKRVEAGSVYIPDDEPYRCETFETVDSAATAFGAMDTCHAPMILNVPDGRAVVTSLQNCDGSGAKKRRSTH
jgi:hypothetical protein